MASEVPAKVGSDGGGAGGLAREDGEGRGDAGLQELAEEDRGEVPQASDCFQVEEEGGQHEEEGHRLRAIQVEVRGRQAASVRRWQKLSFYVINSLPSLPLRIISLLHDHCDSLHQHLAAFALANRAYLEPSLPQVLNHLDLSHDCLVVLQVSVEADRLADVDAQREVVADDAGEETADEEPVHCFGLQLPLVLRLSLLSLKNEVELLAGLKRIRDPLEVFAANLPKHDPPSQKCPHVVPPIKFKTAYIFYNLTWTKATYFPPNAEGVHLRGGDEDHGRCGEQPLRHPRGARGQGRQGHL